METLPNNEYCIDQIIETAEEMKKKCACNDDFTREWHDKTDIDIKRQLHLQNMIVRHVVDHCDITDRCQMANAWEMVAELGRILREG